MKRARLLVAACAAAVTVAAHAATITVGSLSRADGSTTIVDSLNDRLWLGWDATKGLTYAQTVAATGTGGIFAGYSIARNADAQLFVNAMAGGASNPCTVTNTAICLYGLQDAEKIVGENGLDYRALGYPFDGDFAYFLSNNDVGSEVGRLIVYTNDVSPPHPFFSPDVVEKQNEWASIADADYYATTEPTSWMLYRSDVVPDPITVSAPFLRLNNAAINSLGFLSGQFINVGANSVLPNGDDGTSGLATTTNTVTGSSVSQDIFFQPSPFFPNNFNRNIPFDSELLGPWTLSFSNDGSTASRTLGIPAGARLAPFVNSITLSGTSENPTFSWAPPPGTTVNGYRVNIFDKSLITRDPETGVIANTGLVSSANLQPSVTSHTVTASDFTVPGYGFTLGTNYSIEIQLLQTRDNLSVNLGNPNISSMSRVYADFTPLAGGGPVVNLPVVLEDGAYKFNMTVVPGQTYYIDPEVAIGYDYAIGAGDPYFRSVVFPTGIGDNLFDIFGFDGANMPILLADDWLGGKVYDFGENGLSRFRVLGIETSAGLDPASTTAFITGLTFTGAGTFTGTQTPITASVPEPGTLALLGLGLAGLAATRRRKQ